MLKQSIAISVLVAGCSSADADDSPPPPTQCQKADRTGTYRQSYVTESGNCGKLDDVLVSFDAPAGSAGAPGSSCTVISERWSENDCKLERTVECSTPDAVSTGTGVSRQQTQDGSRVTGTFSVNVRSRTGSTCSGFYGFTAVRQ